MYGASNDQQPLVSNYSCANQQSDWEQRGERSLNTLKESQRVANDAQTLGDGILGSLHDQRQQLHHAIDRRDDMSTDLHASSRLISRMMARASTMKCILCFIVTVLIGAVMAIVYFKWIAPEFVHRHSPPPPAPPTTGAPPIMGEDPHLEHMMRQLQSQAEDPTLGVGIIVIVAIGGVFLLACALACGAKPATRVTVICVLGSLFAVMLMALFLAPRDTAEHTTFGPAPPPPPQRGDDLTDAGSLLRMLFAFVVSLTALCGLVAVLVVHCAPQQPSTAPYDRAAEPSSLPPSKS